MEARNCKKLDGFSLQSNLVKYTIAALALISLAYYIAICYVISISVVIKLFLH